MTVFATEHAPATAIMTHRHAMPYISIVVEGRYREFSADGCYAVDRGSLICHPAHHLHGNQIKDSATIVLNLNIPYPAIASYRVIALDSNLLPALEALHGGIDAVLPMLDELLHTRPTEPIATVDWLTHLALRLGDPNEIRSILELCAEVDISAEHASRCFSQHFGMSPQAYRREHRLRYAAQALRDGMNPSRAAHSAGFADQSHFGRIMKKSFGTTPARYARLFH